MVGRYGGEEFAAVLKRVDSGQARVIDEQVRAAIAAAPCIWQAEDNSEEVRLPITVSIGVAAYGSHGTTTQALRERADRAMYLAEQKRNAVCIADVEGENEQASPLEERDRAATAPRSLAGADGPGRPSPLERRFQPVDRSCVSGREPEKGGVANVRRCRTLEI